jgi:hypothetical protein
MQARGYGLLRILKPVEKVVVGPVGSPRVPEYTSKTLAENDQFGPRTGGTREREAVFQHALSF